jgi:hypothetical protein
MHITEIVSQCLVTLFTSQRANEEDVLVYVMNQTGSETCSAASFCTISAETLVYTDTNHFDIVSIRELDNKLFSYVVNHLLKGIVS